MRVKRGKVSSEWPAWWFSPKGVGAMFECLEDVPEGWLPRHPVIEEEATIPDKSLRIDHDAVVAALKAKGIPIHPLHSDAKLKEILDSIS